MITADTPIGEWASHPEGGPLIRALLSDAGFDHLDAKAGCARCQACSGLSAWERVFEKERWREHAHSRAS